MSRKSRARHLVRVGQPPVDPIPAVVRQQAELDAKLARSEAELAALDAELAAARLDMVRLIIADPNLSDEAKLAGIIDTIELEGSSEPDAERYGMEAAVSAAAKQEYADYLALVRRVRDGGAA